MTAGDFRLARTSIEEGDKLRAYVTLWPGFGKKVYWRLSGDTKKSGFNKTSGVIRFKKPGTKVLKLRTGIDSVSEDRKKIGLEMSTDPKFRDPTIRLNTPSTSPLYFDLYDKLDKDAITGEWRPTSGSNYRDNGRRGQYSLEVTAGDSKYDSYFLEIEIDNITRTSYGASIGRSKLYGDTNRNNVFDKGDKAIGFIESLKAFESNRQYDTNSGPWKLDVNRRTLTLFRSGDVSLQGEADPSLFF